MTATAASLGRVPLRERRAATAAEARRQMVVPLAAGLLTAVAGLGFSAVFSPGATAAIILPSAALGAVGALLLPRLPASTVLRGVVGVGVVLAAALLTARALPTPAILADGPRRLVTVGVPADDDVSSRACAGAVTCLAALFAVAAARRARGAWSLGVATVLLLLSSATGLAEQLPSRALAASFAAVALLFLALARTNGNTPRQARPVWSGDRVRRAVAAVAIVAAAITCGVLAASAVTRDAPTDRFTIRDVIDEAPERIDARNPLEVAAGLRRRSNDVLGTVQLDRSLRRLPLASFVDYDGETFPFAPRAVPLGDRAQGGAIEGELVTEQLELRSWPFVVVPHVGEVVSISESPPRADDQLTVDARSGRVLSLGPAPGTWHLTSRLGIEAIPPEARFAEDSEARAAQKRTALPKSFSPVLASAQDMASAGDAGLVEALAQRFQAEFRVVEPDEPAVAGHGITTLACVVDGGFRSTTSAGEATACRRSGTPTQLASAFVLVARQLGVPARLAVGFEFPETSLAPQELRTTALTAWAEVRFSDVGWVPVDPVSDRSSDGQESILADDSPDSTDVPPDSVPPSSVPPEAAQPEPADGSDALVDDAKVRQRNRVVGLTVLLLVVLGVLLALPALLRRRRVARRRRGDPAESVRGAWWEMRDRLAERGSPARISDRVSDVIRLHASPDPTAPSLAALVNQVAFGGASPSPSDSDRIWSELEGQHERWRRSASRPQRIRRYLRYQPNRIPGRARISRL